MRIDALTRQELLYVLGAAAAPSILSAGASSTSRISGTLNERVVVVGPSAAGMTVAHVLRQNGVEVEVLEASAQPGGRPRLDRSFTDYPLPLGAVGSIYLRMAADKASGSATLTQS